MIINFMFIPEVELELCGAGASSNSSSELPTSFLEGKGITKRYAQPLDLYVCARQCLQDWRRLVSFNIKAVSMEVLTLNDKA
jgi:hypothetical protein